MTRATTVDAAKIITEVLNKQMLSQRALAELMNCTQTSVHRWINGAPIAPHMLKRLIEIRGGETENEPVDPNEQLVKLIEKIKTLTKCKKVTIEW